MIQSALVFSLGWFVSELLKQWLVTNEKDIVILFFKATSESLKVVLAVIIFAAMFEFKGG